MYEDYQTLEVVRADRVVTVSFNRPEVKNATNPRMHQELERIFPEIGRDPDAHVVVLTGKGTAFSSGGDIETLRRSLDDQQRWAESMVEARNILMGLVDLDRPVIAKVNGHAIGLGATLALMCDVIIAKDSALIADPHVKIGLVAGDGGSVIWPMLMGFARAKKYLLTGDAITGADAAAMGLVTEAVPGEQLDARVAQLAASLANAPAVALRLTKKSINMALRQQLELMMPAHLEYETTSHLSADHREAVNAFLEKRPPVFTGK